MNQKTIQSMDNIGKTCASIDRRLNLMGPLMDHVAPTVMQLMRDDVPADKMNIELDRTAWNSVYEEGIDRVMGLNIIWV